MPLIAIVAIVIVAAGLLGAITVPAILGGGEDPQPPEPAPAEYTAPVEPGLGADAVETPVSTSMNDLPGWGEPARELPVEERPYGRVLDPSEYGPDAGSSYPDSWDHERDEPLLGGGDPYGNDAYANDAYGSDAYGSEGGDAWGAPVVGGGMDAYDQGLDRRELDSSAQQQPAVEGMEGALRQFQQDVRRDRPAPETPEANEPVRVEVMPTASDSLQGDAPRRVNLPLGE